MIKRCINVWPSDYDTSRAAYGLLEFGIETEPAPKGTTVLVAHRDTLILDGVHGANRALRAAGVLPEWSCYPDQLADYYGRKIERKQAKDIDLNAHIFIKTNGKSYLPAMVLNGPTPPDDPYAIGHVADEDWLWVSEPVNFVAEWRAFIIDGEIIDVRQYRGAWSEQVPVSFILAANAVYQPELAAYSIDVGIDNCGKPMVVETNAGYSIGSYGLEPTAYARFLSAGWQSMWGQSAEAQGANNE